MTGEQGIERIAQIMFCDVVDALGVIDGADVAQFAFGIEDEYVRSCHGAVGFGDGFGLAIVKIGEIEMMIGRADFHFRK